MDQESIYYASSGPVNNQQLQFHNLCQMQSPAEAWPSGYAPHSISGIPNIGKSETPCIEQPVITPVSDAMYATTSTCSWAHTVPSLMPWVPTQGESSIVRFSAPFHPDPCTSQAATSWELMHSPHHLNLKRKTDIEGSEDTPQKVCVTEEKMAARFRDMHISNQFILPCETSRTFGSNNVTSSSESANKTATNLRQLEIMLQDSESTDTKSLILAPEIKKLVEPEKILNTFLNKIEKPSMALVVWQPPNTKLLEKNNTDQKSGTSDVLKNNNNMTPQQLSMMCQQYLSSRETQDDLCQTLTDDVMEI